MLKFLLISYSKIALDYSNNYLVFGDRIYPKSIVLKSSLINLQINTIFRYIHWFIRNSGQVIFLLDTSDFYLFSNFAFFCKLIPNCDVLSVNSLNSLKAKQNKTVVITLFLNSSSLNSVNQESKRSNFPVISFSFVDSNPYGSAYAFIQSDTFYGKTIIFNMLILLLTNIKNGF